MEKIKRVWFDNDYIYMESTEQRKYKLPLSGSWRLKNASEQQRMSYSIELDGTALRWEDIDEDIFITSFYDQDGKQNKLAYLFYNFPMIAVSGMAEMLGISNSLMYQYIYGVKTPSEDRMNQIRDAFHHVGHKMCEI